MQKVRELFGKKATHALPFESDLLIKTLYRNVYNAFSYDFLWRHFSISFFQDSSIKLYIDDRAWMKDHVHVAVLEMVQFYFK